MAEKPFNPFEHHHGHDDHDHDHDHDHGLPTAELDPAQRSLADALQVSFGVLKLIMLVLAVLYLLSGIVWGIPAQEVGVRLRFGQIVGNTAEQAVMRPGRVYFAFPYPIDQVVFIPVASQQLQLNREFWHEIPAGAATEAEAEGRAGPLNPEKDGSLLTGDGNIIHSRFSVKYEINRPLDFIRNITTPSSDPRNALSAAQRLVQGAAEEAIVHAVATVTADDAILGNLRADAIKRHMQTVLDTLGAGILVSEVTPSTPKFPAAVQPAFRAVTEAASEKAQKIEKARQESLSSLNETAGAGYEPIRRLIDRYERARGGNDVAALLKLDARLDVVFQNLNVPGWAGLDGAAGDEVWDKYLAFESLRRAAADADKVVAASQAYEAALEKHDVPMRERVINPIGGRVAQAINEARAARSSIVAQVQAEALAFNPGAIFPESMTQGLLQQYQQSPGVFLSRRWQDMVDQTMTGDIEVFYVPTGQTYLDLNRDQNLKRQREQAKLKAEQDARMGR